MLQKMMVLVGLSIGALTSALACVPALNGTHSASVHDFYETDALIALVTLEEANFSPKDGAIARFTVDQWLKGNGSKTLTAKGFPLAMDPSPRNSCFSGVLLKVGNKYVVVLDSDIRDQRGTAYSQSSAAGKYVRETAWAVP